MRGFSLLETLVAIAILTLAILGPLSLASFTLSRASLSENQIIAYNLAEEGLEFIVNKRDSLTFADSVNGWDNFKTLTQSGGCQTNNGCRIDVTDGSINACSSSDCDNLRRDTNSGLYNYSSGAETIFERKIFISPPGGGDEKQIKVMMSWDERFGARSFTLESSIFKKR